MKYYHKQVLLFCAGLFICFCSLAQETAGQAGGSSKSTKNSGSVYDGKWSETWSYNRKTDVAYHDTFSIWMDHDQPVIKSVGPHLYEFRNIKLEDEWLSFELLNGEYVLPYRLKLNNKNGDLLIGTAVGINKAEVKIMWVKGPSESGD